MRWATDRRALLCGLLLAAVLFTRYYRVTDIPAAPHFDEDTGVHILQQTWDGQAALPWARIDHEYAGHSGWLASSTYPFVFLAGNWHFAWRYACATWGVLSILGTYLLAWYLYGHRVALLAAAFLTFSFWHLAQSRFFPLSACAAAPFIWLAVVMACRRWYLAPLAGIIVGMGLQMYDPIKALLVAVPLWWCWEKRDGSVIPLAAVALVAWFVMQPYLDLVGWTYFSRLQQVTIGQEAVQIGLLDRVWLQATIVTGGAHLAANFPTPSPALNLLELAGISCGLLFGRGRALPVAWLAVSMIGVLATNTPHALHRLQVALPALALLFALGVSRLDWRFVVILVALSSGVNGARVVDHMESRQRISPALSLAYAIARGESAAPVPDSWRGHRILFALTQPH